MAIQCFVLETIFCLAHGFSDNQPTRGGAHTHTEPVSYTHLDVYKRQLLNRCVARGQVVSYVINIS